MAEQTNGQNGQELKFPKPIAPLFGEDLRIDDEDEENLEMLPEIERELILSERFQMLQRYKDEKALYDKYTRKDSPASPKSVGKKRGRSASSSSSYSSSYSDDSSYSSSDDEIEGVAKSTTVESIAASMQSRLTTDQACKIQVTRDLLTGSFHHVPSDLRNSTLLNCFVRIPNGAGEYLITQVVGSVEIARSYEVQVMLPNKERVNIPLSSVSNSPLTDTELAAWASYVEPSLVEETASQIGKKSHEIKTIKSFVWDDSMVNRMVEEKKKSRATGVKLTLEIAKLRNQLLAALNVPSSTTAAIQSEIAKLEKEYRETQKVFENANAHQFGIVAINHRNRMQQHHLDFSAAKKQHRHKADEQNVLNPFKRRECKPVVMWDVGKKSPKKIQEETRVTVIEKEISTKLLLADLIDFNSVVSKIDNHTKLGSIRRSIRAGWSASPGKIWEAQLLGTNVGEVMSFQEWKRRVDEEEE